MSVETKHSKLQEQKDVFFVLQSKKRHVYHLYTMCNRETCVPIYPNFPLTNLGSTQLIVFVLS